MKRKLALLLALATTTTLYGCGSSDTSNQDSTETYSADSFLFDCFFENDIDTITIEGNTISGLDVDENLGGEE